MDTYNIDNTTFLQALFGDRWAEVHVCSFKDDPSAIAPDRRGLCWATRYYGPHAAAGGLEDGNQYLDIALFRKEADGSVRRRKALFEKCFLFALDDVEEKIPLDVAQRLPPPTYKLRTSAGSVQWVYRLNPALSPYARFTEYSEGEICNAQDLLIESDLVPSGKDPGMRGVTRLIRLPGGVNTKASRLIDGWMPFKCVLEEWNPENETSLEAIVDSILPGAGANLAAGRAASVTEGQVGVEGHPVLSVVEVLGEKGDGVYDIVCPNVGSHTDGDDSGTAIWTYEDGRAGIKCHHGSCLELTGAGLMAWCAEQPGWAAAREEFTARQAADAFRGMDTVAAGGGNAVPAVSAPVWSSRDDILRNIVTITEGDGGFFNLETLAYIGAAGTINNSYSDLTEGGLAVTWMRAQPNKLKAQGVGWFPSEEPFIWLGNRKLVNTYQAPTIIPVANMDILSEWLIVCNHIYGDYVNLVLDHMAYTLQFPHKKIRWQVLTVGKPRTGKTQSIRPLVEIMGPSCGTVSQDNANETWGDSYARKKVVVFEEVKNDDKSHFNRLKSKLANDEMEFLNIKGQGYLEQMNLYSIYMFTNFDNALQFDSDQDKLLVIRSPDHCLSEDEVYGPLQDKLDGSAEFYSAAYHFLLNRDVSGFRHGRLPVKTEALYAMCKAAQNQGLTALTSALKHNDGPFAEGVTEMKDVKDWLKANGYRLFQDKEISEALQVGGWLKVHGKRKIGGQTSSKRFWIPAAVANNLASKELYDLYVGAKGAVFNV